MCSVKVVPRGSRFGCMMGSAKAPRCHGLTGAQPAASRSAAIGRRMARAELIGASGSWLAQQAIDLLLVLFTGFLAQETRMAKPNLATAVDDKGGGHGGDIGRGHQFLFGVADDAEGDGQVLE